MTRLQPSPHPPAEFRMQGLENRDAAYSQAQVSQGSEPGLPSVVSLQVQHIHILALIWGPRELLPVLTALAHDRASPVAEEPTGGPHS